MEFFADTKPGPKGPRKAPGRVRDRALALRADDRVSVTEIAAVTDGRGHSGIGANGVDAILEAEGIGRLVRDDDRAPGHPDPAGFGQGPQAARPGPPRSSSV